MNIQKANNQDYGQYIEENLVNFINKIPFENNTGFSFSEEELVEMDKDIELLGQTITGTQAEYVGRATKKANCDLYVDGKAVEIKYVSEGTGTYYNTSLAYLSNELGFTSFLEYTHKWICPLLETFFGKTVYDNFSPVSMADSKAFQNTKEYKELQKLDKAMRAEYVTDLYQFLNQHPEKWIQFVSDMVSKGSSNKTPPDILAIFNHRKKTVRVFSKDDILNSGTTKLVKKNSLGFSFDSFTVQIGWQNGSGLNNPTLRVFLK